METMKLVLPLNEEMTAIRRHIHQHPELSNEEFETTKLIREKLTEYGIEIAEIGLKTGVLGILRGKNPGKTVAHPGGYRRPAHAGADRAPICIRNSQCLPFLWS